ncbi:MAG TPA: ATP-binding cassette domain-containing protein [Gemmatimonadaceae bacterium]
MTPVLTLDIRRIRYGRNTVALRDVALELEAGEIVGVAGHVGAGKTTLALAAAGLLGRSVAASIDGRIVHHGGGHPCAGFVFANPWTQLTELGGTVEEEVAVGPENQGVPSAAIRARVDRALALADATHLAQRVPRDLSGGELQRVALASALALDAPLLVLDEPTAQLDPESTDRFAQAVRSLAASGTAVLIVEQNLELLLTLATRVLVLADGAPLATGSPSEVLDRWPPLDARLGAPASVEIRARREMRDGRDDAYAHAGRCAPAARAPLLCIDDLCAGYGARDVLRDLSLTIPNGSITAWLGANGAGKSTLARTIMGLVPARRGAIHLGDIALDPLPVEERARHVGLVFQDPSRQLFSRTVLEEVMVAPSALGYPARDADHRAREALEAVGLEHELRVHPGDLSSQAQRRLAIAAAMAAGPRLLILDEPTAGQDAEGRAHIARALERQRERGAAAVITHDLAFAHGACDGGVTIDAGQVSFIRWNTP